MDSRLRGNDSVQRTGWGRCERWEKCEKFEGFEGLIKFYLYEGFGIEIPGGICYIQNLKFAFGM